MAGPYETCGLLRDDRLLCRASAHTTCQQVVGSHRKAHGLGSAMHPNDLAVLVECLEVGAQGHLAHIGKCMLQLGKGDAALIIDEINNELSALMLLFQDKLEDLGILIEE